MVQADTSENRSGSIAAVTTRLLRWGWIAPFGLARVESVSENSQNEVIRRLIEGFPQADVPFIEITLPVRKSASEQVRFLRARLAQIESGVVSITGFADAFSEDVPLLESLHVFNYNRENLADFPLCQIWWMSPSLAQMFRKAIPDLNSWFIVKLRLDEIVTSRNEVPLPLESLSPLNMGYEEGANASKFYATRFRTALQRHMEVEVLWEAWRDAVRPLINVEGAQEASRLQAVLLQEASENGVRMRDYLTSEQPLPGLLNDIGTVYYELERLAEAEPIYTRALEMRRKTLSGGCLEVAASLNNLAALCESQGRYAEAETLYTEALAILPNALGMKHPKTHLLFRNLIGCLRKQDKQDEVVSLMQRFDLELDDSTGDPQHRWR